MLHQTVAKRFVERRNSCFTPSDPQMTLVVLGASKVGKTTIVSQYLWKQFEVDYKPTIEEFHWIEYEKENNNLFILQLIDSSGSHDFLAMRQLYYKTGDAFLIVFSVENMESWDEAKDIASQLIEQRENNLPIFLVANKLDKNPDWNDHHVRNFCQKSGIKFTAISAFNEEQVAAIFDDLLEQLRQKNTDLPQLSQLKKRRQSMPTPNRGSVISSLDLVQINKNKKRSCAIS